MPIPQTVPSVANAVARSEHELDWRQPSWLFVGDLAQIPAQSAAAPESGAAALPSAISPQLIAFVMQTAWQSGTPASSSGTPQTTCCCVNAVARSAQDVDWMHDSSLLFGDCAQNGRQLAAAADAGSPQLVALAWQTLAQSPASEPVLVPSEAGPS